MECGYHGNHESVCVSFHPPLEAAGSADFPDSVPSSVGVPKVLQCVKGRYFELTVALGNDRPDTCYAI